MIITRTPYRISFFGGGTDYPAYYDEHGGAVLATTIDKHVWVTCRNLPPFFQHSVRLVYSKIEEHRNIDDIVHPTIREGMRLTGVTDGVEIHYDGELPARSGMASSSAFTVGLLHALRGLRGELSDPVQLARDATVVEREMAKENVGCQDQISTAHGGTMRIDFQANSSPNITPLTLPSEKIDAFNARMMLLHTGQVRFASNVAKSVIDNIPAKKAHLARMFEMVAEGVSCLSSGDVDGFGELLHEAWERKRSLSPDVSSESIDHIYETARSHGALGGKLLGAGGGGFILLYAEPDRHDAILSNLPGLVHVPFKFSSEGSKVVYYDAEQTLLYRAVPEQRLATAGA